MLFWVYADPYTYGRTTGDLRLFFGGNDWPYRDRNGGLRPANQDPIVTGHHRPSLAELG